MKNVDLCTFISQQHILYNYTVFKYLTQKLQAEICTIIKQISYISTLGQLHKDKHKGSDTKQKPKLMLT